ncbi:septal ring factor EnvC (AmiA/AmiB activator) [Ancylobacter sp. 3268]|uniref:murein hydrolase activator EnvC family protein n=1 Tax=Ancylobacter sp. 3268 TaxID=2817752 RepID=UPI00285497A3|nr:peptidoglycan DD-metalloendopeptidase family protein [Ancylobacter sp. 3268]MDR6952435.1 septal ring factor EnvC (AmiA/AmiB activator) [Ancylobacter sp. 3268]
MPASARDTSPRLRVRHPMAALLALALAAATTAVPARGQEAEQLRSFAPQEIQETQEVQESQNVQEAQPPAGRPPDRQATPAAPRTAPATGGAAARAQQKQRMEQLETDLQGSTAEQERLAGEIEALKGDRAKLNAALIDTATRVREVEEKLDTSEQRLVALEREEADIRESLDSRRDEMAEVLGGLARLGTHPPPALLVRPDDALQSVRSAMLLGAVLPELKAETELLASELAAQERVRKEVAAERDALAELKATLGEQRRRTAALIAQRQSSVERSETALAAERERAAAFAAEASNVRDLLKRMETEIAAARKAADAAKALANKTDQTSAQRLAALSNPGRMTPGVAFSEARGLLPLPVSGNILKNFGAEDGYGGAEKGTSFGTRRQAQVAAPSDGWVVYAGPFRSYGQLLIINAGGGYHILLAGMDRITVELGQFVLSGEPVGVMGDGPQLVSSVGLGTAQPILYVEFRKDGISIDPTPWWVTSESEKARG